MGSYFESVARIDYNTHVIGTAFHNDIINSWVQVLKVKNAVRNRMLNDITEFSLKYQ